MSHKRAASSLRPLGRSARTRWWLIALLAFAALAPGTARAASSYAEANQAYEAARYDDAIAHYEALITAGVVHEHLYYNLGNAYFRAGELGHAIYNYERALRLAPRFADAQYNLTLARRAAAEHRQGALEPSMAEPLWLRVIALFSTTQLMVGFLVANALFFLCLSARRLVGKRAPPPWIRPGTALAAVSLAVTAASLVAHTAYLERMAIGIVLPAHIPVREAADPAGAEQITLHAGQRVRVLDQERDWLQVGVGHDVAGWVPSEAIGQLR